jgi:hypothetical protein
MATTQTSDRSRWLTDLSPHIYGTTRLGDGKIPFEERVQVACAALEGTDWFHTSPTYGNALEVLRTEDMVNEIIPLHYRWSDEYDQQAEVWTM